jgi:hypothetical protein
VAAALMMYSNRAGLLSIVAVILPNEMVGT